MKISNSKPLQLFHIAGCYREGASFQTIVSAAREAELLERDDFGGPKRVRTGGLYSGTSSGGRGPHRGGGSFQRQRPVHASLPAIKGRPAARGPPGSGRGGYIITSGSSQSGSTPRSCYGCGDPGHLIRQCPYQTQSGPYRTVSAVPERDSAPPTRGRGRGPASGRGGRASGRGASGASGSQSGGRGAQCYAFPRRPEAEASDAVITGFPPFDLFPQRLICVDYELADHPYFTRSKACADMTDSGSSDQNGLGLVTVLRDEPETSEGMEPIPYNEHIANLMQKMANMQNEIDRLRNLTNLSITLNTPLPEHGTNTTTPPLFPHVDSPIPQYFPPNPSLHKTNPTASKQSTNPQQPNFPQNNPQQANPLPFTTSYVPQTSLTQTPVIQTNSLTQTTRLTQTALPTQKYQTTQHVPVAHTAIPNVQYVPQVYVAEAQPFLNPMPTMPEVDPYEEMEKEARSRTDDNVAREIRNLKEAFKSIQVHKGVEGLEYEDLCVHPDVELPVGYKVPKFDVFDGKGNPRAHLRSYCDKLVGVGKDEAIRMKLFIRSLTGEALDWYTSRDPQKWNNWGAMAQEFMDRFKFNTEAIPDRFYLMKLEKKSTESFREYAMR
ncbi:hypothetical protein KY290_036846 [Solanum tuberosum]|uniref:CCHC-type domain-containing protein n=1 Tax=Solanum tuberosum TaxID=4113 RepID=A0ABQ7TUB5_SOLTU|nr:hypothetical protein KY290_036846 [Solanum tuberosum]